MWQDAGESCRCTKKNWQQEGESGTRYTERQRKRKDANRLWKHTWLVWLLRIQGAQTHDSSYNIYFLSLSVLSNKGSGLSNLQAAWQHVNSVWEKLCYSSSGVIEMLHNTLCGFAVQQNPAVLTKLQQPSLLASVEHIKINNSIKSSNTLKSQPPPLRMKGLCERMCDFIASSQTCFV